MRKYLFAVLAALTAGVALAFTPVAHTNSYVRDGVTYVQRGGLGTADYVVTNVTMPTISYPVTSVNSKTGAVVLVASDVTALPDNSASLIANNNFKTAVEAVSPPVELPSKWAFANVTNATGGAVTASDVQALPNSTTHLSGDVPVTRKVNNKELSADITLGASDVGARANDWMPTAAQVGALPDNQSQLEANNNFKNAVASLSPQYWALNLVTNDNGEVISGDGFITLRSDGTRLQIDDDGTLSVQWKDSDNRPVWWKIVDGQLMLKWYDSSGTQKTKTVDLKNMLTLSDVKGYDTRGTVYAGNPISCAAVASMLSPYITEYVITNCYLSKVDASTIYQRQDGMSAYQTVSGMSAYETTLNAAAKLTEAKSYAADRVSNNVHRLKSDDGTIYQDALGRVFALQAQKNWSVYSSYSQESVNFVLTQENQWYSVTKLDGIDMRIRYTGGGYSLDGKTSGGYWNQLGWSEGDTASSSLNFSGWTATSYSGEGGWNQTKQVAYSNDVATALQGYVPTTRKVNGQALTQDITIEGMTDNAVVWTNSTLQTKAGATVNAMDYQAMTNTVNEVKAKFYDQPLQVEWTVRMVNGDMKLYATTNVNTSVLNN